MPGIGYFCIYMKKILTFLPFLTLSAGIFAQETSLPRIDEIAEIENDDRVVLSLFSMPKGEGTLYFLNVGTLGIGDDIFQLQFDPLFQLFIPLGETLGEAIGTLEMLQGHFQQPKDAVLEIEACFAPAFPNENREMAKVTNRRFLFTRQLQFSIEREGYLRATYVSRSDFNSLVGSARFYRTIHPDEP